MSTTRWRQVFFGSLLLAPCAIVGFWVPTGGNPPSPSRILWEGDDTAQAVAFSPDGTALAIGTGVFNGSDGVGVIHVASGEQVLSLSGHKQHVLALAFSADGQTLTTVSYEAVKRWDVTRGTERTTVAALTGHFSPSLALSPDSRRLALGPKETRSPLRVFQLANEAKAILDWESPPGLTCLAFSRDSRSLAAGHHSGSVRLWDIDARRERSTLPGSDQPLTAMAFSPDGATLATASVEGSRGIVKLWDLATGAERSFPGGHTGIVSCLTFSPDGQTLASGSQDETIRLWDVAGGVARDVLSGHSDWINSLAFAPDGRTLASASSDHTVRLWDVDAAKAEIIAKGR